ncbi:MAG TPA: hypothetical protein ENO20_04565 [Bacteroides sp.]|nr:hypothetical protein [Bacteroides sp.]
MKQKHLFQLFTLGVVCSFLTLSASSLAAKNPDFTGKWKFNETESTMGEGRFFAAEEMSVTQDGKAITIERTRAGRDGQVRTTSETITLDGKENVDEQEYGKSTYRATWSDDNTSLIIETETEFQRQGETFTMSRKEIWSLDKGGKVLTIESTSSSQRGTRSATLIYDKI